MTALALFALALQLFLAFGHVHVDRNAGASAGPAHIGKIVQQVVRLEAPAPLKPSGLGGDLCAVCASIKLVGALIAAAGPAIASPDVLVAASVWVPQAAAPRRLDHLPLNARGPPHA